METDETLRFEDLELEELIVTPVRDMEPLDMQALLHPGQDRPTGRCPTTG